ELRRLDGLDVDRVAVEGVDDVADMLGADAWLTPVRQDERGGRRPRVGHPVDAMLPVLMDVTARDDPHPSAIERGAKSMPARGRHEAPVDLRFIGVVLEERLVDEQRDRSRADVS